MSKIVKDIEKELKQRSNPARIIASQRWFKEEIKTHGIRTPEIKKIGKKYFPRVKTLPKKEVFAICEELFASGYNSEIKIATDWVFSLKKKYAKEDLKLFERWLKKYITNWGTCDDFATHVLGDLFLQFPRLLPKLNVWAKSSNRWVRRAAAVSLIYPLRRGKCFREATVIADILLLDADDMVQKGYGWMLKEASVLHLKEVNEYVLKHKKVMPRTALRYAIEKFPKKMRKLAMIK